METEGRQNLDIKCDITRRSVLKGALAAGAASLLGGPLSAAEAIASPGAVREYWIADDGVHLGAHMEAAGGVLGSNGQTLGGGVSYEFSEE